MSSKQRPMSPFMIGPYYRPQLTSMLSITHRLCGVFLSVIGGPLMVWWLAALASGPDYFAQLTGWLASPLGILILLACLFALIYHLFNGIRHMVWDLGKGFDLPTIYASGLFVAIMAVLTTATIAWVLL